MRILLLVESCSKLQRCFEWRGEDQAHTRYPSAVLRRTKNEGPVGRGVSRWMWRILLGAGWRVQSRTMGPANRAATRDANL